MLWEARGFPPHRAQSFFSAQVRAGEIVQRFAFERWVAEEAGPFQDTIDFDRVLRPELERLFGEMETHLVAVESGEPTTAFARGRLEEARQSIEASERIPDEAIDAALAPFRYALRAWR